MKPRFLNCMMAAGALLGLAVVTSNVEAGQQPAGNIENGKKSFDRYSCASCHGYSGNGASARRVATTPRSFDSFVQYVRKPTGQMPAFATENQIPDAALRDIYAFLKSIPPPPDPKTIPLLQGGS
jgi:mono/diheme cytochrome c family protein